MLGGTVLGNSPKALAQLHGSRLQGSESPETQKTFGEAQHLPFKALLEVTTSRKPSGARKASLPDSRAAPQQERLQKRTSPVKLWPDQWTLEPWSPFPFGSYFLTKKNKITPPRI